MKQLTNTLKLPPPGYYVFSEEEIKHILPNCKTDEDEEEETPLETIGNIWELYRAEQKGKEPDGTNTFISDLLNGEATGDDLMDYILDWRMGDRSVYLTDYLGLSDAELSRIFSRIDIEIREILMERAYKKNFDERLKAGQDDV
jgi:hypothetical protein